MAFLQYGDHVNKCSGNKQHNKDCAGDCGKLKLTNVQVDLNNEVERWNKAGRTIIGIPDVILDKVPESGFPVNLLSLDQQFKSLMSYLVEKGVVDEQEFLEHHRKSFCKLLKEARQEIENAIVTPIPSIIIPGGMDPKNGQ